jgi:hypothetical protein
MVQLLRVMPASMRGDRSETWRRIGLVRAGMRGADPVEILRWSYPIEHAAG